MVINCVIIILIVIINDVIMILI